MAHGFTVEGGLGADGSVIPHDSSAHSVLVPDTELLFTAQFHRAGPDLVLTGRDGQHHLIPGYFASEHHPALVAPNGAHLSPDTVDLLAGSAMPGHYAQAQPTTPPDAIGKIEKVVGDVTVVRNGATVALHVGDAVFKSDVVATGSSSSCGISFPDGTVLNLVANTRMALNEYAYDANSNGNGALFTLVEGTFAFVAGKVAHTGDMKIATPVATMGIRGTTGVVQEQPDTPATITANAGGHTYTFAVMPDIGTGITGMWDVYLTDANGIIQRDANGNPIVLVTVSQSGYVTYLTPQGLGQPPLVSTEPATNSQYAFEQEMLHQLFLTLNPLNQPNGNNGSSTTPPPFELPNPIPQLLENGNTNINLNGTSGNLNGTGSTPDTIPSTGPLTVVIWIANGSGLWNSGQFWLGGSPPSSPQEVIIPDHHVLTKVTTVGADSAAGLEVDNNSVLNIVSGTSFTIYDFIHGAGTVQLNASGSDPTLFIHGAVPLVGGGTIKMIGTPGDNYILGAPGTGAVLINVDYTIEGTGTIGGGDGLLTFENFGTVNANNGVLTVNTGNQVYNDGVMEATVDPVAATIGTLWIQDSVVNAGTVQADGAGTAVTLSAATFDNLYSVVAENGGSVTFINVAVTNEAISATDPAGGTINAAGGTITFNGGSIANGNVLESTLGGVLQLEDITVNNTAAGELNIVGASSELDLMNASVIGGTDTNAGNVVVTNGASVLHGDSVTNTGTMTVEGDGASLTLEGNTTLLNDGSGHITATDGGLVTIDIDADENVNSGIIEAVNGGEVDFHINIDGGSNHGLIEAGAGGTVRFFQTHNGGGGGGGGGSGDQGGNYGTMEAADGGHLIFDGGLDNFDLLEAVNGGTVDLKNGLNNHASLNQVDTVEAIGSDSVTAITTAITINGDVINDAKIEATGFGAQISITDSDSSENAGTIIAEDHGTITLSSVQLENDHCATVEANGATINFFGGTITNDGTFKSDHQGAIFVDSHTVYNDGTGVFEALSDGLISFGEGTVYNGVTVSGASGGTIEAMHGGSVDFATTTVYNGSSVAGTGGGTILASCGGTVSLSLSCTIYNNNDAGGPGGVIEALRGGTVDIDTSTVFNDGGTIQAIGCGAVVDLFGTDINDGTLASSDGGVIEATFGRSTLQDVTILGGSVLDAADTGLGGSFLLSETTTLAGGGIVTFEGTGEFLLGGDIVASTTGTTLKSFSTIDGSGQIGAADGKLTLDNESGGTIDANEPGFALTIHTGHTVTNAGTLEATTGGPVGVIGNETLKIEDAVDNSGTIESSGAASVVQIDGDVTNECTGQIGAGDDSGNGGTVTFGAVTVTNDAGGDIGAQSGGQVTFDHSHVENHGHIGPNGGTVTFDHSVVENDSAPSEDGNGGITADGGGTITFDHGCVTNSGAIEAQDGSSITFEHDHVVNSAGTNLDGNGIGAFDSGTITFTDSCIDNTGFIRASFGGGDDGSAGTIYFTDSTVNNDGGTISAVGTGTIVQLADTTIKGGTLFTDLSGLIEVVASDDGDSVLDGSTNAVTVQGVVKVEKGAALDLAGTITDNGTIEIVSGDPDLVIDGIVTLNGSGSVNLDATGSDIIGASTGTNTLDNSIAIKGSGGIGAGDAQLTLKNETHGVIDATGTIAVDTGSNHIVNFGLMEATIGGSALYIYSDVDNCGTIAARHGDFGLTVVEFFGVTVSGNGTIEATGADAVVRLAGATIIGGTVESSGGGIIETPSGTSTLSGVTINDGSILKADTGSFLDLEDTTTINGTVTFEGGGTFMLDDPPDVASIVAGATGGTLDIAADATLTGSGDIGDAGSTSLTLNNAGTIDADGDGAAIDIETGNTITNTGLIEATDQGSLEIDDSVNNYGATPGTIKASGGGSITLLGTEVDSGSTTAGVAGGTIEADASSSIEFDNVTIGLGSSVASGGGTLDAAGGTITVNNGELDIGSATSGGAGTLEATCDGSITLSGVTVENFGGGKIEATHGGSITFDGGTLNDGSATADVAGGLIEATNCGTITFNNGTVNIGAGASGGSGGTVEASHGGTINFEGATTTNAGGTIEALRDGAIVFDGGTLDDSSETADIAGGTVEATAACATFMFNNVGITLDSAVAGGGGTIKASNGGAITFNGGTINSNASAPTSGGTIEALTCGTIRFNGTNIYNQGSSIEADGVGAMIMLAGAMILGGTLETSASGIIETVAGTGNTTFDGVTIATGSTIQVDDDTTLTLQDTVDGNATVTNDGTITLVQGCDPSLIVNGDITLAGGGTVVLSGDTDSIVGNKGPDTLSSANAIEGAGTIGGEGLVFSNLAGGVVDADVSGHTLVLDTGTTVTNLGTLEATNGGTLEIDDNVCNVGGTIAAYGCGSVVELEGVTIKGGMFLTDDSTSGDRGVIEVVSTDSATVFDGGSSHAISIGGFVQVDAGATLKLIGTIDLAAHDNNGTIDLAQISTDGGAIGADLVICGTVTLTGSGGITMQGHAAQITAAAPGAALDNGSTISGAGSIGTGNDWLHLVNETAGVINADNASADSLTIDIGCNTIVNHGLLEATGGGTLDVVSHVDNSCGSLLATSGGVLDIESTICGGTATIHGATLEFAALSNVNVTFDNGSVASPTYGTLVLGDPADFCGTIFNFTGTCPDANHSDTIDLADFKACNTMLHATYNGDDGITSVCVVDATDDLSVTLKLAGQYTTDNFTIASDGKGGIDIYDPPTAGAKNASSAVTTASSNDHATAPADQNATDHAAGPANEAGFLGDQGSPSTAQDGTAAPPVNQLALAGDTVTAPPSAASAPGDSDLAGFGSGHVAVPPAGPAPGGTLSAGAIQVSTGASQIAIVVPGAPVLDSEHLTDSSIVDGSGTPDSEATSSTAPTAPANEHAVAPATVTAPAAATSPTLASASLGGSGSDSFAFHPNLGGDTAQNAAAHTNELAHNDIQVAGPALASIAPEFHQEFAFDAIHQDAANVAATVDQFHQMAANSTLLH